jgi:hypothetical protein
MKALRPLKGVCLPLGLLLLCSTARNEAAAPTVYQATGTREQIQPVIDQFKHDIIYGVGGSEHNPPPHLGSYSVATLDDVDANFIDHYSWDVRSGGLRLLGSSSSAFYISDLFPAFSSPNSLVLSTPASSRSDFLFLMFDHTQRHNAFGAVFGNATSPSSARLETILGGSFFNLDAPATQRPDEFSFIGFISAEVSSPTAVRMNGNYPLDFDALPAAGSVSVDDLILGVAPPIPEPSSVVLLLLGGLLAWTVLRSRQDLA